MPSLSSDARFLGIDLRSLWRDTRQAWVSVSESPALSWLTPEPQVVLLHADGGQSFWCAGVEHAQPIGRLTSSFTALELPEDLVLRRSLALPRLGVSDLESAVGLQARSISPFPADDLVWGYATRLTTDGGVSAEVVMASRRQVAEYAASQAPRLGAISDYEVWVRSAMTAPVVLRGYGEGARRAYGRRSRNAGYALLVVIALLLLAMALTPSLQLRMRATEAAAAYQALTKRVAPQVAQRETMMKSIEKLNALSETVVDRVEPLRVLDMLTRLLPDDTAVQSFKLQGRKVTLSGIAGNASALMQLLGEQPGLRDVKAPSPATRVGASTKETFVIEFMLDLKEFGVVPPPAVASAATAAAAPAAGAAPQPSGGSTPAAQAAGPATAPATAPGQPGTGAAATAPPTAANANATAAPAATRTAADPSVPTFGGGPTFGGSAPAAPSAPAGGKARP